MPSHFLDRFLEIEKKKVWQPCPKGEDCGRLVYVRVSEEESARETVMETCSVSLGNSCTLIFELWSHYRPMAEGRVSTHTLVTMRYFIYDKVL